jgi:hypothetical protein
MSCGKYRKLFIIAIFLTISSINCKISLASDNISFDNPLVDASDRGSENDVVQLIRSGTPIDSRGLFGVTPLMRASYQGHSKIVKILLSNGADFDAVDRGGATALHLAARKGNIEVIKDLVDAGSHVDQSDSEGWTPLMRATNAKQKDAIELLLTKGASPYKTNKWHNNAIIDAVQTNDIDIVKTFVDNGAMNKLTELDKEKLLSICKAKKNDQMESLILDGANNAKAAAVHSIIVDTAEPKLVSDNLENSQALEKEGEFIVAKPSDKNTVIAANNQASKEQEGNFLGKIFKSKLFISNKKTNVSKDDIIELPKGESFIINSNNSSVKPENNAPLPLLSKEDLSLENANSKASNYSADKNLPPVKIISDAKDAPNADGKVIKAMPWLPNVELAQNKEVISVTEHTSDNIVSKEVQVVKAIEEPKKPKDKTLKPLQAYEAIRVTKNEPPMPVKPQITQTANKPLPKKTNKASYSPSDSKGTKNSFWLEVDSYSNVADAEQAYHKFKNNNLLKNLRVRVVKPYFGSKNFNVAIRVGPLNENSNVDQLCHIISEGVGDCYFIKDFGRSTAERSKGQSKSVNINNRKKDVYNNEQNYWLQLGSFATEDMAVNHLRQLNASGLSIFKTLGHYIATPKQGSNNNPLYFLRVGPVKTRIEADDYCESLAKTHQTCVAVKE